MADIATPTQQTSTPTISTSIDISSVTPQNVAQSGHVPSLTTESSTNGSSPDLDESKETVHDPPKPAFAWGKPCRSSGSDAYAQDNPQDLIKAKSLLSIMAEEKELSRAEQARKEEDEFTKQTIEQSLLMQQQDDDLALALRLSKLDAGIDVDMGFDVEEVSPSAESDMKLSPVPAGARAAAVSFPEKLVGAAVAIKTSTPIESKADTSAVAMRASLPNSAEGTGLSEEELASIQLALQQAEDEDMQKSLQLAMQLEMQNNHLRALQQQEAEAVKQRSWQQNQGNVRVISREEFLFEQEGLLLKKDHGDDEDYCHQQESSAAIGGAGFRINAQHPQGSHSSWTRLDGSSIILGPNQEIRTKHDPELQGQANAHRLHLDQLDEYDQYQCDFTGGNKLQVGNKAYNSFQQTMKKKTVKGVASHGQGRANTDTEKTKEGALDSKVRLLIGKAINQDYIDEFHGCIKEGKEALVYHATSGDATNEEMGVGQMDSTGVTAVGNVQGGSYDVAVKVFKRIQEFRNRGQYVQGDPRYHSQDFSHSTGRVQLEIWAEKEYRNLIRAYRVGIPVPQPLLHRENVLFLRFLGQEGWPCPQLREIKIKKKSQKWVALYQQTMEAIQKLYQEARLVHGDLSEYNLLVCPSYLLLRKVQSVEKETKDDKIEEKNVDAKEKMDGKKSVVSFQASPTASNTNAAAKDYDPNALRIALIDFGQAVDTRHPQATALLGRDLLRVKQFFSKMGITTLSTEEAMKYVTTKGAPLII